MTLGRLLVAFGFMAAGAMHFLRTSAYESICPSYLPNHKALVLISGAAEVAGGIGLLIPQTRRAAGYGLIALLVAVFPANINMAVNAAAFGRFAPAWALWLRLPLQIVIALWVKKTALEGRR